MKFQDKLQTLRKQKGISQEKLAEKIGISRQAVAKWEVGQKECLLLVPKEYPYRGPLVHQNGEYKYHCIVNGDFEWFNGYEEIFCNETKVYECIFHGGCIK